MINKEKLECYFDIIEMIRPQCQDNYLEFLAQVYNFDIVDLTNCFLDYSWSNIDDNELNWYEYSKLTF